MIIVVKLLRWAAIFAAAAMAANGAVSFFGHAAAFCGGLFEIEPDKMGHAIGAITWGAIMWNWGWELADDFIPKPKEEK